MRRRPGLIFPALQPYRRPDPDRSARLAFAKAGTIRCRDCPRLPLKVPLTRSEVLGSTFEKLPVTWEPPYGIEP